MSFSVSIDHSQAMPVIQLTDTVSNTTAQVYAFGALLNAFTIQTATGATNVVDGFASIADAQANASNGFKSSFLSPFTCRMDKGTYNHNDTGFTIDKFYLEQHAIHGILFDAAFTVTATNANDSEASVTLSHQYNGQDAGYPFAFAVTHIWCLKAGNHLTVTSHVSHHNAQAIPYAQGWHPYFVLDKNVDDCTLQFDSNTMLEFDETLIPTGTLLNDTRFANGHSLQGVFLDNCFALDTEKQSPKCVLTGGGLQLTILPDSSYPYLQVYTPDHRKSVAIENLSGAPDCFNNGFGLRLIEPDTTSIFATSYNITLTN